MIRTLLAWLRESWSHLRANPAHLAAVGLFAAAGSLAGVPVGQAGFNYTWSDARFCDDCHVHDYANEAWARSQHADLTTCHDCHLVPIRHYPRNLWLATFDRPQGPEDIHAPEVQTVICERCHSVHTDEEALTGPMTPELRERVVKIDESPLHRVHLDAKTRTPARYLGGDEHKGGSDEDHATHGGPVKTKPENDGPIGCMDCHGSEQNRAHRFEAGNDNCQVCHEAQGKGTGRLAQLACRECHFQGFLGVSGTADAR